MSQNPALFQSITLGPIQLDNRIMVSPMCQYSAHHGLANDWHRIHLGSMALSGAGLLCLEATAVNAAGRITPHCLGLYNDACVDALRGVVSSIRSVSSIPLCLQLAHAGRKASSAVPWEGGKLLKSSEGGWPVVAPSAISLNEAEPPPQALSAEAIQSLIADFVRTTERAVRLGFEAVELHMAHGYLLHQFLSPLANQRKDSYGGSLENRMRLPLQVFSAVRKAAPESVAIGVRISASDWIAGGWDVADSVVLCQSLEERGCQFIDVSSGGLSAAQKIDIKPGYQVPFADTVKQSITIPVIAVGLITEAQQAEAIINTGQADMVALARGMLFNPRWPWHAAAELGGVVSAPQPYWRSTPHGTSAIFGDVRIGQR